MMRKNEAENTGKQKQYSGWAEAEHIAAADAHLFTRG
jgi:hypothetical protein